MIKGNKQTVKKSEVLNTKISRTTEKKEKEEEEKEERERDREKELWCSLPIKVDAFFKIMTFQTEKIFFNLIASTKFQNLFLSKFCLLLFIYVIVYPFSPEGPL